MRSIRSLTPSSLSYKIEPDSLTIHSILLKSLHRSEGHALVNVDCAGLVPDVYSSNQVLTYSSLPLYELHEIQHPHSISLSEVDGELDHSEHICILVEIQLTSYCVSASRFGHILLLYLGPAKALNRPDEMLLFLRDKCDRPSGFPRSCGSSDPVHIVFW